MNCPSRNDEDPRHPDWNQNPPPFAPDLTTRQDLNGIVNSRLYQDIPDPSSIDCSSGLGEKAGCGPEIPADANGAAQAKLRLYYRDELCPAAQSPPMNPKLFWVQRFHERGRPYSTFVGCGATLLSLGFVVYQMVSILLHHVQQPGIRSRIKRATTCGSGNGNIDYDLPLHVGALFIILFVSSSACAFPMLVVKFPRLHIPASFLFIVRHFGTGVLIATAFVHLLPTAFTSLGDPCLSKFWTEDYPAMPGAIALAAVFLVALIEMIFSPGQQMCGASRDVSNLVRQPEPPCQAKSCPKTERENNCDPNANNERRRPRHDPLCGRATSLGRGLSRMSMQAEILDRIEAEERQPEEQKQEEEEEEEKKEAHEDTESISAFSISPEMKRKKALMQCVLLEVGILFHSVFIGMALSVSIGNDFVILLIAIAFHQTFEGLALGSRIAALTWSEGALQPWLMALAYGCTTPLGQAIGLATHTLYNPQSEVGLVMVGTMNAISSGLLVYASLVELLSEDFLSDESWRILRGKRRVYACLLVFFGAAGMSLVGAWA